MDMETDELRWFQRVVDGMTVTEVAQIDRVSQPGVSRALARLERQVGTPLLYKNGRILRPTQAGNAFKRHVDSLMHALDDGIAAVNEVVDPETGTVALAFQLSLGTWLVPGMISRFRREHPRVRFRLEESDDALGSSLVSGGRIDLEFTGRRPRNPDVHWEPLFAQPLVLAVPAEHPLAERSGGVPRRRGRGRLRDAPPDVGAAHAHRQPVRGGGLHDPGSPSRATTSPSPSASSTPAWVSRWSPPPTSGPAPRPRSEEPRLRLTDPGAHREVGLAWSKERRLLPSAEMFRQHVLEASRTQLGEVTRARRPAEWMHG